MSHELKPAVQSGRSVLFGIIAFIAGLFFLLWLITLVS